MSVRLGLRPMRKALWKVVRSVLEHNPLLIWYVTRWRWRVLAYYSARLRDTASFQYFSRVIKELEETANTADGYTTDTASLVVRNLAETASVSDGYTADTASLEVHNLAEAPSVSNGYSIDPADLCIRGFYDYASAADAMSRATAQRITREYAEAAGVSEAVDVQSVTRVVRELAETVKVQETPLSEYPWPEDPTKSWWQFHIFEKALVEDVYLWYSFKHHYEYKGAEMTDQTSVADDYTAETTDEWWYATKYDGYTEAETIYNFVVTKYDGYYESTVSA